MDLLSNLPNDDSPANRRASGSRQNDSEGGDDDDIMSTTSTIRTRQLRQQPGRLAARPRSLLSPGGTNPGAHVRRVLNLEENLHGGNAPPPLRGVSKRIRPTTNTTTSSRLGPSFNPFSPPCRPLCRPPCSPPYQTPDTVLITRHPQHTPGPPSRGHAHTSSLRQTLYPYELHCNGNRRLRGSPLASKHSAMKRSNTLTSWSSRTCVRPLLIFTWYTLRLHSPCPVEMNTTAVRTSRLSAIALSVASLPRSSCHKFNHGPGSQKRYPWMSVA